MRGTVTLAAALALPTGGEGGSPFPYRDLILLTAFGVVLGTLVLQGLTLRPLLIWLRLQDDGEVEREVRFARAETLRAALAVTPRTDGGGTTELIRRRFEVQLRRAEEDVADSRTELGGAERQGAAAHTENRDTDAAIVRDALDAQRRRLMQLRADDTIGDAAFQRIEEELDFVELGWAQLF